MSAQFGNVRFEAERGIGICLFTDTIVDDRKYGDIDVLLFATERVELFSHHTRHYVGVALLRVWSNIADAKILERKYCVTVNAVCLLSACCAYCVCCESTE